MSTVNCTRIRTLLMPYLDSELDAATTVSVSEHLSGCGPCRERFAAEERLEAAIVRPLREERMPPDVWRRVQGALRPAPRHTWRWLAAAAVVLVAVALAVHDPGYVSERELVADLVAAHHADTSTPLPRDERGRAWTRTVLDESGFRSFDLPKDGRYPPHELRLVGAREEAFHGVRAVNVVFDCCGTLSSVFVLGRDALESLPDEARPRGVGTRPREGDVDGVLTSSFARGGLYITVVSRHSVDLAGMWSS